MRDWAVVSHWDFLVGVYDAISLLFCERARIAFEAALYAIEAPFDGIR
jgi:hypothetical protein